MTGAKKDDTLDRLRKQAARLSTRRKQPASESIPDFLSLPLPLGTHRTEKGYIRYHVSPYRGQYHHRVVISHAAREFSYYPIESLLSAHFHVHHVDGDRANNSITNLLVLDHRIHNHLSGSDYYRERDNPDAPVHPDLASDYRTDYNEEV